MACISTVKTDITTFNDCELQELFNYIGEILCSVKSTLNEDFKESRFSKEEVCPYCESTSIVKNGKLNRKQRYICKSCKKSFNDLTKSALSCTKLPIEKWLESFNDDKDIVRTKNMLIHSVIPFVDTKIKEYKS